MIFGFLQYKISEGDAFASEFELFIVIFEVDIRKAIAKDSSLAAVFESWCYSIPVQGSGSYSAEGLNLTQLGRWSWRVFKCLREEGRIDKCRDWESTDVQAW